MARTGNLPQLRHHRPRNLAVVRLGNKDFYCGPWDLETNSPSEKAIAKYHRVVAEWVAGGGLSPAPTESSEQMRFIAELVAGYIKVAKAQCRRHEHIKSGLSSFHSILAAVRYVAKLYADTLIEDFGPVRLKVCRTAMIDAGLARTTCNRYVARIRRMFAWAAENELIDPVHPERLKCVSGLRRRQGGRETRRVRPVGWHNVASIADAVSPQVWAMVQLQWYTGMRPGEAVIMTTRDIDTTGKIWLYQPSAFKTEHCDEDAVRIIALGPRGIEILKPWLRTDIEAYLFAPAEAEAARLQQIRDEAVWYKNAGLKRRSPSKMPARRRTRRPSRPPRERYTTETYRRAIQRACEAVEIDVWSPNQLRHSFATKVRKEFADGMDHARASLGHLSINTTLEYAELDKRKAMAVARKIG